MENIFSSFSTLIISVQSESLHERISNRRKLGSLIIYFQFRVFLQKMFFPFLRSLGLVRVLCLRKHKCRLSFSVGVVYWHVTLIQFLFHFISRFCSNKRRKKPIWSKNNFLFSFFVFHFCDINRRRLVIVFLAIIGLRCIILEVKGRCSQCFLLPLRWFLRKCKEQRFWELKIQVTSCC